jgi:hypothetical protein
MKLTSAEASEDGVKLTFERDGETVVKLARISEPLDAHGAFQVAWKAREAVRDFAFKKYGPDEWQAHVPWGGRVWGAELTEAEKEIVKTAVILLREQAEARR